MELLAPAGSKEAFVAAVNAGADAVYIGVENFNARLNADNLSLYDLEVLTNFARSKNVKTFLAFNTLIKHEEIYEAAKTAEKAVRFSPDAFIVQDLGLARIIKEEFPQIPVHASTQLAVHNSAGVEVLGTIGFKRIVLARELSKNDIKAITAKKAKTEIEIFCHGALCFCVSGMCLFSSIIGSRSGNRGWCTQPCRRLWKSADKKGYLFSPKDFELINEIPFIKKIGVDCIKIEGRMRSSEYVFNAVKAYRILIDAKENETQEALQEAGKYLSMDFARSKTTLFFTGIDETLFNPEKAQCLGLQIGSVVKYDGAAVTIKTDIALKDGDRIRITDPSSDRTKNLKLTQIKQNGDLYTFDLDEAFKPGCFVFKAGDSAWNEKTLTKEVDQLYRNYTSTPFAEGVKLKYSNLIARQWEPAKTAVPETAKKEYLWIKIDNTDWLEIITTLQKKPMVVLSMTRENMHEINAIADTLSYFNADFSCELTPYITQKDLLDYEQCIKKLLRAEIKYWVLNNISQFKLIPEEAQKVSGHFLYALNAFSARALKDLGVKFFTVSWEDDYLNIQRLCQAGLRERLLVYLYGYPVIVRSRMADKRYIKEGVVTNALNEIFKIRYESASMVLLPAAPVMNFTVREKLSGLGLQNFGIDLSFMKPDKNKWKEIYKSYIEQENVPETLKFNYKRLLK
ncbi:MAG: hypothetical protein A2252_05290 [Elusimicrobia bacterium RIFOXYA2_FULL_39_19]|nr:MAG: hypothetical protein A2252_05290 [Elusimicrobia bacterium RIFOXYA2_FULL_39_19]